jgi:hypothetical protein
MSPLWRLSRARAPQRGTRRRRRGARELLARVAANLELARIRRQATEAIREEARTLETLNRTGALAGQLGLERLVQTVTDAAVELTGAQLGAFFYNVLNEKGESYTLYTLSGAPREAFSKFPMPRNTAVFDPTFKGEGIIRSDDIKADPRYGKSAPYHGMPPGHLPVRSYLAVPVVSRAGDVMGGLFFGHEKTGVSPSAPNGSSSGSRRRLPWRSTTPGFTASFRRSTRRSSSACRPRSPSGEDRGGAPPIAEDGGRRPADRGHRPRLQQSA